MLLLLLFLLLVVCRSCFSCGGVSCGCGCGSGRRGGSGMDAPASLTCTPACAVDAGLNFHGAWRPRRRQMNFEYFKRFHGRCMVADGAGAGAGGARGCARRGRAAGC
jgi:hypothetical protein